MATKNDVTGDMLISRVPSEAYKNNYDLIFRKGNPKEDKHGSKTESPTPGHGEGENTSKSAN